MQNYLQMSEFFLTEHCSEK